jgi:hypothetical protein
MNQGDSMPIKSVWLGLNFEEAALNHIKESYAGENYAVELCAREKAHLSVFLAAPIFKIPGVIPGAGLIPAWNEPEDGVNANRRGRAEEAQKRLASAAKSARVTAEFHIAQDSYATLRENLIASARPSDVVILSRPGHYLSFERSMIEAVLFTSGRPIVLVPPSGGEAQGSKRSLPPGMAAVEPPGQSVMQYLCLAALMRSKSCVFLRMLQKASLARVSRPISRGTARR